MNVTDYTYLMNKPDAITEKQAEALGSVLNEFPYFQSARALRLKGLYNQNSFKYNYALKVTAAHTADRSVLFDFITSEAFTSIQNDFYEKNLRDLLEITVFDSEIISPEQIKKALEVKTDPTEQSILNPIKEVEKPTLQENPIANETGSNVNNEISVASISEPEKTEEPEKISIQNIVENKEDATTSVEEVKIVENNLPEIDPSIFKAIMEAQSVTYEEQAKIEEPKTPPIIDESYFTALRQAQSVIYEKPVIEEENKIIPAEISIDSVTEVQPESVKNEEPKIDRIENSILSSIKVSETPSLPEPVKIEGPKNERIENSILSSIKEAEAATADQSAKTEEEKTISIVEEPVVNSVEEDEDDSVIEEMIIPEFKMNTIEQSILSSIKEAETKVTEQITEEIPEVISTAEKAEETTEEIVEVDSNEMPEEINETAKTASEHLEIGKPLDFSLNEKHSFQEWLQLSRTEPIDRSNEMTAEEKAEKEDAEKVKLEEERQKKAEIIDKFIENNPKISPIKPGTSAPVVQFESNSEDNSYLMTETLARVYLEQKKYTKAIQAYEILILKYPEKITFFADRISDIKILQQNNNNNN